MGYLLHDLAEPLCFARHLKMYPALRDALLAGYRTVGQLPAQIHRLDDFLDFAAVTTIGYIAGERTRAGRVIAG